MKCPFCACEATKVVDKRDNREDSSTRRRRQCLRCGKRFTTYERVEKFDVSIIKRDGSLEKFNSSKIVKGIRKAVDEERVTCEEVDLFAEEVERYVLNSEEPVKSLEIGLMVLDWLKSKDPLSYIRFASVYKKFDDLEDIEAEIKSLKNN
jgi:transcriptional repressor NrdR